MKTKLRRLVSILSAMVLMVCCAVPAFALDDLSEGGLTQNAAILKVVSTMVDRVKAQGGTLDDKNYIAFWYAPSESGIIIKLISFPTDTISATNGKFNITRFAPEIYCYYDKWDYTSWDDDRYVISTSFSTSVTFFDSTQEIYLNENSSADAWHIIDTNMTITNNGEDITPTDPNAVPAPFTVTYSPDLKLNLKRKTSDYETKSIDITLTLNQDYLDWYIRRYAEMKINVKCGKFENESIKTILDSGDIAKTLDLTGCGKSKCIYFISLSDPSKPLKTVTQNSVYTYLSQQRYSIVDKDNGDIDGSTSTAVYANGLYPYFNTDFSYDIKTRMQSDIDSSNCTYAKYLEFVKDLPSFSFSIPLKNINVEKFEVISVLNSILTCETVFPTESGQSVFDDSFKSIYNVDRGPNGVNFNNIDYINVDKWDTDDTGYSDYFSKSDCYTVYSERFSFDSYPKYAPLKDGKGNDIDMIKTNPFDYSMHPVKPGTYQSVGQDGTLSEERTEEEQKKHDEDVKNAQNFANVDFGIDGIKSIFDGTSVFYSFLTASIAILPNYFLIILGSFFVCMLAICVVKWVLK